ncbi:hypothetical protein ABIB68_007304 [Bradyrhizobium sp. F1.2.2]
MLGQLLVGAVDARVAVTPDFRLSQTIAFGTPPIARKALTCTAIQSANPSDQRASAKV